MSRMRTEPPPGYTRFRHGSLSATVVSDGLIEVGPPRESFPHAAPAEIEALLTRHYLPSDTIRLNQNVLVIESAGQLVMFDSGVGTDPDLGIKNFGSGTGLTIPNLRAAGIDAADIDIVALTHAHPDHAWGIASAEGAPLFPNARVAIGRADHAYWTDLSHVADAPNEHVRDQFLGAHKNLGAYADRLLLLDDGDQVVSGIRAIATPGHSPGHMVYEITSDGETMICWGDLCHHHVLLLEHPDWSFRFDFDGPAATRQRRRIYDLVDSGRYRVFGYHFPFPGVGNVRRDPSGFTWLPADLPRRRPD